MLGGCAGWVLSAFRGGLGRRISLSRGLVLPAVGAADAREGRPGWCCFGMAHRPSAAPVADSPHRGRPGGPASSSKDGPGRARSRAARLRCWGIYAHGLLPLFRIGATAPPFAYPFRRLMVNLSPLDGVVCRVAPFLAKRCHGSGGGLRTCKCRWVTVAVDKAACASSSFGRWLVGFLRLR